MITIIAKKKLTEAKILFNEAITYKQDTKSFYNEINYHNINITEKTQPARHAAGPARTLPPRPRCCTWRSGIRDYRDGLV